MASLRRSIFSPSLDDVLGFVDALSAEDFAVFAQAVASTESFDQTDERCLRLANQMHSDSDTVRVTINAVAYLYGLAFSRLQSPEALLEGVLQLLQEASFRGRQFELERMTIRLTELLRREPARDQYRKAQRLKEGFVPNAASFSSLLDLRPNFAPEYASVSELIPVVQFRITTDSDKPSEKHLFFQMDRAALAKMKEEIERVEKKLIAICIEGTISSTLVNLK